MSTAQNGTHTHTAQSEGPHYGAQCAHDSCPFVPVCGPITVPRSQWPNLSSLDSSVRLLLLLLLLLLAYIGKELGGVSEQKRLDSGSVFVVTLGSPVPATEARW